MTEYIIVKKPKRRRFRREEVEMEAVDLSLADVYKKKKEELDGLGALLKAEKEDSEKKEADKKPKPHSFTFTEGMLLAFMAQYFLGPVISKTLQAYGVH